MSSNQLMKGPGTQALLYRILESPEQVSALQHLPPPTLARLIHHVGLEDAGELVALATTQQLARIFDDDLWRGTRPGQEERFDAERFGLWLEVLLEMGADRAAARLAEMDEDFLTFALSGLVLVLDMDVLTLSRLSQAEQGDGTFVDKALESSLSHELERFLLIARGPESWDAVLSVLVALDEAHHELLMRLLERCCHHASEYIEDNGGLYTVLTSAEQLESDVAQAREERREREGFVAPTDAAAFLGLARAGRVGEDPITRGYARIQHEVTRTPPPSVEGARPGQPAPALPLVQLLQEAEVLTSQSPAALLGAGGDGGAQASATTLREALAWLQEEAPEALSRCMRELGYLSNVLVSGCGHSGRPLRALEAAQVAIATCNLGMEEEHLEAGADRSRSGGLLAREGLVPSFGRGWRVLHEDVVMRSARAFDAALARKVPAGRGDAAKVRAELARDIAAGRPWASRRRWVHLAPFLSKAAFAAMRELVDECPVFNGSFFATREQVEAARRRVEELLAS